MSGRARILGAIRRSLGRGPLTGADAAAPARRIEQPARNLVPARAARPKTEQVELFCTKAQAIDVTIDRVAGPGDVPAAVAAFLAEHNLPSDLRLAPDPDLAAIPWADRPMLEIRTGAAEARDQVGVTPAFSAIAETGTLAMVSSPETPNTINFVPDNHIVVLRASQVVGATEDVWDRLRARFGPGEMPRTVTLVSGPSRSADIELTLIKGAHGPRRVHVVLIDDVDA